MKSRFLFAPADNRCLRNAGCRLLLVIYAGLGFQAAAQTVNLITPHDVSLVVKNGTVSNKTDFHLLFAGNLMLPPPAIVLPGQPEPRRLHLQYHRCGHHSARDFVPVGPCVHRQHTHHQ